MGHINIPRGSVEYVVADLADKQGRDLSHDTFEISIYRDRPTTWLPAVWDVDHVRTTNVVDFSTYVLTTYNVAVRVADAPETPIVHLGTIRVTN